MPIPCRCIAICACITARPTPAEEAQRSAPALWPCRRRGEFLRAAAGWPMLPACLAEVRAQNRLPIFVGGSGLYFKALTRGLSAVPPIPPSDTRRRAGAARARRRRGAACRAGATRSEHRRTPETARPHPHRARARGGRGHRAFADRLASRGLAAAVATASSSARCFSRPIAISSTRASMRASMRC